jgi:preprotein translocase subunit SecE
MKDKIITFFQDVVKEMKKVTWPTKEELLESTKVVIIVCIVLALFTYVIDLFINEAFKGLF